MIISAEFDQNQTSGFRQEHFSMFQNPASGFRQEDFFHVYPI